jgi:hypothetical protein
VKPPALRLELALESHPNNILEIGVVPAVPAVGDYVDRENSGWFGYVKRRRWNIREDGTGIDVRCWLHKDPA